jgi:uncharacterized damage-inducible protein DinB
MYRTIDDFAADWAQESQSTLKMLRNLTDASLEQRITPKTRSAGRLGWHLAASIPEMLGAAGITGVAGPEAHAEVPATAAEIADAYAAASGSVVAAVKAQWTDEMLAGEIPMYGMTWTRGQTLSILIRHEAHHRGQLSMAMRHAGLAVPGPYGPAQEEWAAMGMEAMA